MSSLSYAGEDKVVQTKAGPGAREIEKKQASITERIGRDFGVDLR